MSKQIIIQPDYYFKEASYVFNEGSKDTATLMVVCALVDYGLKELDILLKDPNNPYYKKATSLKDCWVKYFQNVSQHCGYSVKNSDLVVRFLLNTSFCRILLNSP